MRSHASPIDRGPLSARTVAALVTLIFVSVLAVGVAPGVASATDLEREGSDLIINISDVKDPEVVTVNVTDSDSEISYRENVTDPDNDNVRIDVTDPHTGSVSGTNLQNVTVNVSVRDGSQNATFQTILQDEAVPLHTVQFATDRPAWIDSAGDDTNEKVSIPLNPVETGGLGIKTAEVEVTTDTDDPANTAIDGTISRDNTQLVVDRADLTDAASRSQHPLTLQILSDAGPVIDDPSINPTLRSTGEELVVWYPLLKANETYSIDAKPSDGEARYTGSAVQGNDGYLTLPIQPGETEIKVSANGETLIDRTGTNALEYEKQEPLSISTNLTDDGNITLGSPPLEGVEVRSAIVESNGNATFVDDINATVTDGQLSLDEDLLSDAETLLLSTTAGDVAVTLNRDMPTGDQNNIEQPEDSSGDGVLGALVVLFAPAVVGVVIGLLISLIIVKPLDGVSTAGLLVVGFGFTLSTVALISIEVVIPPFSTSMFAGIIGATIGTLAAAGLPALTAPQAATEGESDTFTTDVIITDGSRQINSNVTVHYQKANDQDTVYSKNVRGGRASVRMDSGGTWEIWARAGRGSARTSEETVDPSDSSVELTMPVESSVTVVDAVDGSPITDATISGMAGISETTDRNGAVSIDPPENRTDTQITFSHDRYVGTTEQIRFQQNASTTIELDRKVGRLRGSVKVDGIAVAATVQLEIVPDDRFLKSEFGTETVRTDADGTLAEREVPIGQYRVVATIAGRDEAYKNTDTTVTVSESESVHAEVDAQFTWQLDADHRDRVDRIRQDLRSIPNGGGRDGEIPRYYISVVESMLDVVESVPETGHKFVGYEVDPAEAVEGVLAAADRTAEMISEAMTTKRNVDLFAACDDMPSANAQWSGSFELTELLNRLETDSNARRREVKQRYETVDQFIEDRRGRLSEVAPAREVHKRTLDLTRTVSRGPEAVAVGYTSLLLLDAVEELFNHDGLRERLTRTVF